MSFEDTFLNFCLSCDGSLSSESEHGPYCSQACRLADLEKSGSSSTPWSSTPSTPMCESSLVSTSSLSRSFPPATTGFQLPPAIDFAAYQRDLSTSETPSRADSASARSWSIGSASSASGLPPAVTYSQPNASPLSPEAKAELRRYESLFDQTRRRGTRASWSG